MGFSLWKITSNHSFVIYHLNYVLSCVCCQNNDLSEKGWRLTSFTSMLLDFTPTNRLQYLHTYIYIYITKLINWLYFHRFFTKNCQFFLCIRLSEQGGGVWEGGVKRIDIMQPPTWSYIIIKINMKFSCWWIFVLFVYINIIYR